MSNEKNEYSFEFPIEGVCLVTIKADSLEEAVELAKEKAEEVIDYASGGELSIYYDKDNFECYNIKINNEND